ncbi:unnamed protein product [Orchesella dallaii]|uniref:Uncharacterized protein n=1 Tax=Orchesella dallaii TaxID=48710 RepID=A0ABP1S7M4_9HEXA
MPCLECGWGFLNPLCACLSWLAEYCIQFKNFLERNCCQRDRYSNNDTVDADLVADERVNVRQLYVLKNGRHMNVRENVGELVVRENVGQLDVPQNVAQLEVPMVLNPVPQAGRSNAPSSIEGRPLLLAYTELSLPRDYEETAL